MPKKIQHIRFDSILACSDYLEKDWPLWQQSRQSGDSFDNLLSHSECKRILAAGGYDDRSAKRMKKAQLDIHKIPAGDLDVPECVNAPVGHRPNVGAFLAGSPMSMARFVPVPQPNKSVKMLVSVGGSAMVPYKALMNRGAAILGAIDNLQTEGYAVELTVGFFAKSGNSEFHTTVKVKDFHDTWNPGSIAFMLAEPSFFRRSLFAVCNIEQVRDGDSAAADMGGTLGTPIRKTNNVDYDIEFESLHGADGWTPENSAEKAMTKVYEWLNRNKAGAA
jgi:hypothetical protein